MCHWIVRNQRFLERVPNTLVTVIKGVHGLKYFCDKIKLCFISLLSLNLISNLIKLIKSKVKNSYLLMYSFDNGEYNVYVCIYLVK